MSSDITAVVFDCDSTLTAIEGIDYLAKNSAYYAKIKDMTRSAMAEGAFNKDLYLKRLELLQLSLDDLYNLAAVYKKHATIGAAETIAKLQTKGIECFVMSAGLEPAVSIFATSLGIAKQNVFAVNYDFERKQIIGNEVLTSISGKAKLIAAMKGNVAMVGDGANDLAETAAIRIGFGGNVWRDELINKFDVYVSENNLSKVLPYILNFDLGNKIM